MYDRGEFLKTCCWRIYFQRSFSTLTVLFNQHSKSTLLRSVFKLFKLGRLEMCNINVWVEKKQEWHKTFKSKAHANVCYQNFSSWLVISRNFQQILLSFNFGDQPIEICFHSTCKISLTLKYFSFKTLSNWDICGCFSFVNMNLEGWHFVDGIK